MFLNRFRVVLCLILSIQHVSLSSISDYNYLKDHFMANLIEENREMFSAQLTEDIEKAINLKIEGFLGMTEEPAETSAKRSRRDTNDLLLNEKSEFNPKVKFYF